VKLLPSLNALGRWQILALAGGAVGAIAVLDHATGAVLPLAPLYLLPVALTAWFVDLRVALLLAGLGAAVRLGEVGLAAQRFEHPLAPYWNIGLELAFIAVIAYLVARLRAGTEYWVSLARTDALTSLLNRRAFAESAHLELARAERYQRSLTIAYLDIDDFKQINDRGGHPEGDRLLVTVADTLKRNLRAFDVVARYGGDEFVVLLAETDDEAAGMALGKLLLALEQAVRGRWPVTFSIGAVTVDRPRTSLDQLLAEADALAYAAKQDGKACLYHRHLRGDGSPRTPSPSVSRARPALPISRFQRRANHG
jgi:diguanylate cyclase (GGDEF)-like protein